MTTMTRCNCPQCNPVNGECPAARELADADARLRYVTRTLIDAGLDDGASPVEKMARRAVEMSKQLDALRKEQP
jgi:hypothetical protein